MAGRQDPLPERLLWRTLGAAGEVFGPARVRPIAAAILRVRARTERGHAIHRLRVARRSLPTPGLCKLPEAWSWTEPRVRVRRLGCIWELDLRDNLQRTLYYLGTYEPSLLRTLHRELRRGDVVVDVGAHVGVIALSAARRLRKVGGGRVVAFEPAADSAAVLRAGAQRNGLTVEVVEAALGRTAGTLALHADPDYDEADAGVRSPFGRGAVVQQVPVIAFDAWAEQSGLERLDVVKLDVEGAELAALEGMRATLRRLQPRLLVVEVKRRTMERAGVDPDALRDLLRSCGYAATRRTVDRNEFFRPLR